MKNDPTIKTLQRNQLHEREKSHDMWLLKIDETKVKITYRAYNAAEHLTAQMFNGLEFVHLFDLLDLGQAPNKDAYNILAPETRKKRAEELFDRMVTLVKSLLLN